jgi:thymidine phosphorylase
MFLPQEIIRRKRDGETLSSNEIEFFIDALTNHRVSDSQAAAFAMDVFFKACARKNAPPSHAP